MFSVLKIVPHLLDLFFFVRGNYIKMNLSLLNILTFLIQNNIKLLAYDKTDISNLTENDFIRCLNDNFI